MSSFCVKWMIEFSSYKLVLKFGYFVIVHCICFFKFAAKKMSRKKLPKAIKDTNQQSLG